MIDRAELPGLFRTTYRDWKTAKDAYVRACVLVRRFNVEPRPWDPTAQRFVITQAETDARERRIELRGALKRARTAMRDVAQAWAIETMGAQAAVPAEDGDGCGCDEPDCLECH